MADRHNMFVHGNSGCIEDAGAATTRYVGDRVLVDGRAGTTNWIHFAIPSPVIVDERRLRPGRVWVRYRARGGRPGRPPVVHAVHFWDGDTRIAEVAGPSGTIDAGWTRVSVGVDAAVLAGYWGLGVSVGLEFPTGGQVEIATVGCDFDYANRIGPQRLPIRTDRRRTLELPYLSSRAIDRPDDSVTRILVSLHGTGADADLYLANGLAAAGAAGALGSTLVIAPQFIYSKEYYRASASYPAALGAGGFPAHLLHWRSGRAYASDSEPTDLTGGGVPNSGTISSFAVLDTLLERVSKPALFPNLSAIVVAGQSNGGQFVARYAATSRFEEEVAAPRGLSMRYVSMSSGSYLYLDRQRAVAGSTTRFEVPAGCAGHDDWPWGLGNADCADVEGCAPPYVRRTGARYVRSHFARRDVVYLQGINDTSPHNDTDCGAALQGSNCVEKGEIYLNYLRHYYRRPVHARHVVPGVGHSGRGLMTSPDGLAALFGP